MSNAYQEALALYTKTRSPSDINLIEEVRKCLNEVGLNKECSEVFDKDRHILDLENNLPEVQRHYLNIYWNRQIISTGQPAYDARFSLVPDGSFSDWVRLFKTNVIPLCIQYRLPIAFNELGR